MIHDSIVSCIGSTPLMYLHRLFPHRPQGIDIIAKLELLNPGGSVKDRPARYIIEEGLREGKFTAGTHLIESTSGNLGIALAMVAQAYDLTLTCVVDPKTSPINCRLLQLLGAQIEMVHEPDDQGGYLKTRIQRVHQLLENTPNSKWINQYANQLNWMAHYYHTAEEILVDLEGTIDCIVVAVSTTGTIHGLARRLRHRFPHLRVVAVDAVGSVIFNAPPGPRELPGIGSSRVPELLHREEIDDVVYVNEWEAIQGCRSLVSREGVFAGGSSGAVVAAIEKLLPSFYPPYRVLAVFPDRGERYIDTVYNDEWIMHFQHLKAGDIWPTDHYSVDQYKTADKAARNGYK